jgi:hypothetical protein
MKLKNSRLEKKGMRVFRFHAGLIESLGNVLDTALLVEVEAMRGVPQDTASAHTNFVNGRCFILDCLNSYA